MTESNTIVCGDALNIQRIWAMPNKWTFTIKPIKELLDEEIDGGQWIDPFCGKSLLGTIRNDINPERDADFHMDGRDFLKTFNPLSVDGVLFDPPFSRRQVIESYSRFGIEITQETTMNKWWQDMKRDISKIIKVDGKAICFGWNSEGIGKTRGFRLTRILMVPHGAHHNDTIVTVETKIAHQYSIL